MGLFVPGGFGIHLELFLFGEDFLRCGCGLVGVVGWLTSAWGPLVGVCALDSTSCFIRSEDDCSNLLLTSLFGHVLLLVSKRTLAQGVTNENYPEQT